MLATRLTGSSSLGEVRIYSSIFERVQAANHPYQGSVFLSQSLVCVSVECTSKNPTRA